MKYCKLKDCNKKHKGLGYCKNHYELYKRNGKPIRTTFNNNGICSIPRCDKKMRSLRMCSTCLSRYRLRTHRMKLINKLGGPFCRECGFTDIRGLQFDHIHNDGYLDKKRLKRVNTMVDYYLTNLNEAKKKLQILCASCNSIKKYIADDHKRLR